MLDSDGQHDPGRIPAMLEAARGADAVIGWRRDRRGMPPHRRVANRAASLALLAATRTWLPDTQNGMRLFRTEALRAVPLPDGGYEAESRHLRALLGARRPVASVEIPTIYDGEPSHFRPVADTLAVGRALLAPSPGAGDSQRDARCSATGRPGSRRRWPRCWRSGPPCPPFSRSTTSSSSRSTASATAPSGCTRRSTRMLATTSLLVLTAAVASAIFLRRPRYVIGTAIAVVLAGYLAGAALEVVKVFIERARPEEVIGAQVQLSHDRSWAHIASYPSGHLIVTTAMAAAAAAAVPRPALAAARLRRRSRLHAGALRRPLPPRRRSSAPHSATSWGCSPRTCSRTRACCPRPSRGGTAAADGSRSPRGRWARPGLDGDWHPRDPQPRSSAIRRRGHEKRAPLSRLVGRLTTFPWKCATQGPPGKDAGTPGSSATWATEDAAWRALGPRFRVERCEEVH